MTQITRILFIIDRSGSMQSIAKSTIDGINSYITEQKSIDAPCTVTISLFDDKFDMLYKDVAINEAMMLDESTYQPRGYTALYDAVCKTINESTFTENDIPVVVIMTDGQENASREYKAENVKALIDEKTAKGWKFVFLGANQDAVQTGTSLGIAAGASLTYSADMESTSKMFKGMSAKMFSYRSKVAAGGSSLDLSELNFTDEDRKDVQK